MRANNWKGRAPPCVHDDLEGTYNACFEAGSKTNRSLRAVRIYPGERRRHFAQGRVLQAGVFRELQDAVDHLGDDLVRHAD